jgi:hypothetical protein
MARISAMARPTVYAGVRELDAPPDPQGRIRWPGGGPKRLADTDPGLLEALEGLVDPDTRGDPGSPLRWTTKSTRQLAEALTAQGHPVSDDTVRRLLKQQGYTLQRTRKTLEGAQHPDRPAPLVGAGRPGRLPTCRAAADHRRCGQVQRLSDPGLEDRAGPVRAELDRGRYPLGVRISDRELAAVPLHRHDWHGERNYTVLPIAA